jgi:hypothetical protein
MGRVLLGIMVAAAMAGCAVSLPRLAPTMHQLSAKDAVPGFSSENPLPFLRHVAGRYLNDFICFTNTQPVRASLA